MRNKAIFEKYKVDGSTWEVDLLKVLGSKVKSISGYVSREFGDPVFKISSIELEDGRTKFVEGEHDFPYVCVDDERLMEALCEDSDEEESGTI